VEKQEKIPDIVRLVEQRFDMLSPQLQLAARYILSFPDDVAVYSMREIAARASVKPSTMVRLATRMGYANYNEFRDTFRKRLAVPASGYAARARELQLRQSRAGDGGLISDMLLAEQDNLQRTLDALTDKELEEVAHSFIRAQTIYIVGLRKCASVASFFHYATRVFFPNARLVTGAAGLFTEEISQIGLNDVMLTIAFDPYTRETVEAANAAKRANAELIAVTDSAVSPLAKRADHVFIAANRSPSFYRSLSGALMIVQILVAAIVTELGEAAVSSLEQSDKRLRNLQTYWKG